MATLDLGNLVAHLRLDGKQFVSMLNTAEKRMKRTAEQMERAGRTLTMRVTAPILAVGAASVKAFASFDDAMTKSVAIMGDMSAEMRQEMEKTALVISKRSVTSATDLAKSYFFLASAGLSAKQSIAALATVEKFAVAGAFDMSTATDLVTDAQSALGLRMEDATANMQNMAKVADVLTGANTLANASTLQFSKALTSQAGPAMKAYGIQLEEGVAVLAAYADQGIKAEEAGSMFSRMLRLMTKGFLDNRTEWKKLSIEIFTAQGALKPMSEIITDLSGALEEMSTEQKIVTLNLLGFQARSQQAILPLLGLGSAIAGYQRKLKGMQGITQDVTDKQLTSFTAQMKILWGQIKAVAIEIGENLAPRIEELGESIKKVLRWYEGLNAAQKNSAINWALWAALIGPVTWALGTLLKALIAVKVFIATSLVGATGALILAFAGLSAAYVAATDDSKTFMDAWGDFWEDQINGVKALTVDLKTLVEAWNSWTERKGLGTGAAPTFGGGAAMQKEWEGSSGTYKTIDSKVQSLTSKQLQRLREKEAEATHLATVEQEKYNQAVEEYVSLVQAQETLTKTVKEEAAAANALIVEQNKDAKITVNEMLRALNIEYNMLGKINEERERAVSLSQFETELKILYGEAVDRTTEQQLAYNDAMEQYAAALQKIADGQREFSAFAVQIEQWLSDSTNLWKNLGEIAVRALDSTADAINKLMITGKADFKQLMISVLSDLNKMIIKMIMAKAIMGAIGMVSGSPINTSTADSPAWAGANSAMGNAFNAGKIVAFSKGGVIDQPTMEPMALMGEAGPEAVMPLSRGADGKLGVKAQQPTINVEPRFKIVNVYDKEEMLNAMRSDEGEKVFVNLGKRTGGNG